MNIQKVWDAFIKENDNPSFVKMAYAVVEQLGGVNEDTLLNSLDSCRNANDGYTGFWLSLSDKQVLEREQECYHGEYARACR